MSQLLPRLRLNLDFMPSPVEDRPGLLVRDSYGYSPQTLIIPPLLAHCLQFFDGQHTELDLREELVRATGDLESGGLGGHLLDTLRNSGFLEDEIYQQMRDARHREFAEAPVKLPAHAGAAYPADPTELTAVLKEWMGPRNPGQSTGGLILPGSSWKSAPGSLTAIASPHVSPVGGFQSYAAAYGMLDDRYRDRTFVVLGTSHYGQPEKFGLTRKNYRTPWGDAQTDLALVNEITTKAPNAVVQEDFCHAVEHSIEFQVVFLQNLFGPSVRVVPVLCGPFAKSLYEGGKPEDDEGVRRMFGTLGEIAERDKNKLLWVLGIDMAHMGQRYGDDFVALADEGEMSEVARLDKLRIGQMERGDARGFWDLVQPGHDELKWCGSSPVYTFLKSMPGTRGSLQRYEQWNIDEQSVVSFAGMSFT